MLGTLLLTSISTPWAFDGSVFFIYRGGCTAGFAGGQPCVFLGMACSVFVRGTSGSRFLVAQVGSAPCPSSRLEDKRISHSLVPMWQVLQHPNHWRAFAFMVLIMMGGFTVIPYITLYSTANVGFAENLLPVMYLVGGSLTFLRRVYLDVWRTVAGKARLFDLLLPRRFCRFWP